MGEIIDVNELLKQNKKFYKLTNKEELHYGLQYQDGLNVDPNPFNPSGECSKGGMYFFEQSQLLFYCDYVKEAYWIREVVLLHSYEPRVYREENKYKTDTFFLKERKRFDGDLSKYVTKEMCLEAVKKNGYGNALRYVPIHLKTEEMCLEAVNENGRALQFVLNKFITKEMCLEAVKKNGFALQFVPTSLMTEEICFEAVKQNRIVSIYVPTSFISERIKLKI